MKNSELREAIDGHPSRKVFVVDPSDTGTSGYAVAHVTDISGSADTIIETRPSSPGTIDAGHLVSKLSEFGPDGDVQIYIHDPESAAFAYFDIAKVLPTISYVDLVLGDWRTGG